VTKKIINADDNDLFRQSVGDVRSIKTDKVLHKPARPKPKPLTQPHDLENIWKNTDDSDIDAVSHEESLSYTAPGIQNSVLTKLRKGKFGIQAEIDLHGLNSNAAKLELVDFLATCTKKNYRCVHIIHGKGYRSTDDQPVLKNNINRWLRQHKDVQAFCSAPAKHGGAGAVYVLLKLSSENLEKYD
jgi:DNA-nicking Smr family endonuclease